MRAIGLFNTQCKMRFKFKEKSVCFSCKVIGYKSFNCPKQNLRDPVEEANTSHTSKNSTSHGMIYTPTGTISSMFLKGSIGDQPVIFHLDTGTTRTVLSEKLWLKSGGKRSQLRESRMKVTAVTTQPIEIVGEADVGLTIGVQRMVIAVQVAKNVSENCFLGIDAISLVKGGAELLASLVNLFRKPGNFPLTEAKPKHILQEIQEEDTSFESIQSAKTQWVKKRYSSCSSNEGEDNNESRSKIYESHASWPHSISGAIGNLELKFKIDQSLEMSLISEQVWKKSGSN